MIVLTAAFMAAWLTTILMFAKSYKKHLLEERTEQHVERRNKTRKTPDHGRHRRLK